MLQNAIRSIAIYVFRDGDRILVSNGYDAVKHETFYRSLDGGIEFGEQAEETIAGEVRGKVSLEVQNLSYPGVLQNLFTLDGEPDGETVFAYDSRFAGANVYRAGSIARVEDTDPPSPFTTVWKHLPEFGEDKPLLYPAGLLDLLAMSFSTGT